MKVIQTEIPEVLILEPVIYEDERGFFLESYNKKKLREVGIATEFVQDNHARSGKWVLRGLHFQLQHPQAKLVTVGRGEVFDVAVDIRQGSPTFGHSLGTVLSDENHRQVFIPEGFAHGYCVLSDSADFFYKCSDYYAPDDQYGIAWDDRDLGIDWPLETPVLSQKDRQYPRLRELGPQYLPTYKK